MVTLQLWLRSSIPNPQSCARCVRLDLPSSWTTLWHFLEPLWRRCENRSTKLFWRFFFLLATRFRLRQSFYNGPRQWTKQRKKNSPSHLGLWTSFASPDLSFCVMPNTRLAQDPDRPIWMASHGWPIGVLSDSSCGGYLALLLSPRPRGWNCLFPFMLYHSLNKRPLAAPCQSASYSKKSILVARFHQKTATFSRYNPFLKRIGKVLYMDYLNEIRRRVMKFLKSGNILPTRESTTNNFVVNTNHLFVRKTP